ncbi:hypothetical protein EJ04DRAFT_578682 [Polyplosphaeria fusca]|uniref:CAP-Gly domain-containing protein n=1 Tax=Polyplosphaeria fusca TaxID=682080 RepID=A0A9P4V0D9_9PLEO|nr:hypothetical protein EJ04DRAFT_578682 [Polyplosphaeria fusca]
MADFKVGQTIETVEGKRAIIRYIGDIHVSDGQFLGVELATPAGKNDGSVKGERYFQCAPQHGLFMRAAGVSRIVSQPAVKSTAPRTAPRASPAPQKPRPRPSSIEDRPKARPSSVEDKPKPRPSSIGIKPPPRTSLAPKRQSIAPPPAPGLARTPSKRTSISSTPSARSATDGPSRPTPTSSRPTPSSSAASTLRPSARDATADSQNETKIRVLEKQLAEHRERLKELEQVRADKDRFEGIIQKLQTKCQNLVQESQELKNQVKATDAELERLDRAEAEHESILELATLDREMAEERAEQAESDLQSLRERLEEQELELEILRSESENLTSDMSEDQKATAGYFRLESERDRLRDALLRLKEITDENEASSKSRIHELESDLESLEVLSAAKTQVQEQLVTSEATVDDLRQQLEASNAAEEMVEELSGQNFALKEQLADKDVAIQDLQDLKELNDQLEIHHIGHASELREELEARDAELAEYAHRSVEQDTTIADQETLITKFRDLVVELQSKMTDAESSKVMSDEQAKDVTGRFNEVMELNRRLRTANLTSTVKTITSELQKLQADEAGEELEIVKHYLPDSPEVYKNDSLRVYFRAKRISSKSALISSLIKNLGTQSTDPDDAEQPLSELCRLDCIYQLTSLDLRSTQFWSAVSSSSLDQFSAFGPSHEELGAVEKTLERCLEALKKDELNYREFSENLRRSNTLMRGIIDTDHKEAVGSRPEDEIMFRVSSLKSHFDVIRADFESLRSWIQSVTPSDSEEEEEDSTPYLVDWLNTPIKSSAEASVVAGKLVRTLKTLQGDSLYPRYEMEDLLQRDEAVSKTAETVRRFAAELTNGRIPMSDVLQHTTGLDEELTGLGHVITDLNSWNDFAAVLKNCIEIEHDPAPWVIKANEIEARKRQGAEAEKQLQHLTAEHHATMLQIREREEIIDTKELEIEHLKAKHREAAGKVEELAHLQNELREADKERKELQAKVKAHHAELQELKTLKSATDKANSEARPATPTGSAVTAEKHPVHHQPSSAFLTLVDALQAENKYLRSRENRGMFGQTWLDDLKRAESRRAPSQRQQKAADEMLALAYSLEEVDVADIFQVSLPAEKVEKPSKSARLHTYGIKTGGGKGKWAWIEEDLFGDLSPIVDAFEDGEALWMVEGYGEAREVGA